MGVVVPAVLAHSRTSVEETLKRFDGLVSVVQIDVVDGRFAGPATWPYTEVAERKILEGRCTLPFFGHFSYEIDLMVERPEDTISAWIEAGASRIVVHVEGVRSFGALSERLSAAGHEKGFAPGLLSFGIALNTDTDIGALDPYLPIADYVQFMGIKTIGKQGQPFDKRVIRKIEAFRKAHPDMPIQVDGGVTRATAPLLLSAGVRRLVVGHDLTRSDDVAQELERLEDIANEYGRYA